MTANSGCDGKSVRENVTLGFDYGDRCQVDVVYHSGIWPACTRTSPINCLCHHFLHSRLPDRHRDTDAKVNTHTHTITEVLGIGTVTNKNVHCTGIVASRRMSGEHGHEPIKKTNKKLVLYKY